MQYRSLIDQVLLRAAVFILFVSSLGSMAQAELPMPPREFRAAWIATVANIDWPSRPGLPSDQIKTEYRRIVDRAAELHLNALILQIRPAADALFPSNLEPWSPYLTSRMGQPPQPMMDPLAFAIDEAHKRGLELHVWFNPYRALHKSFKGDVSENHISQTMPDAVVEYGGYLWLDPGNRKAAQHSLDVILDVVRRYDIDGIHMDDYFYPYPVNDEHGNEVPFPDDASFAAAKDGGFEGSRSDWRRQNVDWLIRNTYEKTKAQKPRLRVGISPFGIWRPGHPESIQGFDAYEKLYADARKWLRQGWVDYLTPQLYWKIESKGQSYPKLLDWWCSQNEKQRYIWPGNYASRVGMPSGRSWQADEIVGQIDVTRKHEGASGNVLFSMKSLFPEYGNLGDRLKQGSYATQALTPLRVGTSRSADELPWLWITWKKIQWQLVLENPSVPAPSQ